MAMEGPDVRYCTRGTRSLLLPLALACPEGSQQQVKRQHCSPIALWELCVL